VVLLVLAVLWGIVLIPPALRNRAEARQGRSVENFRKRLEVLAPPPVPRAARPASAVRPAGSAPPRVAVVAQPGPHVAASVAPKPLAAALRPSRAEVLRRRRQVFGGLCLAAVLTLALVLVFPGLRLVLGIVHALADAALAAYVTSLRRLRQLARERMTKVRYLPVAIAVSSDTTGAGTVAEPPAARSAAL
jgi:hypothetical protein